MQNDSLHMEMLKQDPISEVFMRPGMGLNIGYGSAPHTVRISGCAILAVNRYCFVHGFALRGGDEMNHRVHFTEEMTDDRAINIILVFLNRIQAQKYYDLTIINALDLNGNIAYGTVLSSIWRMVSDQENLYEWEKQEKMEEYLEKFGIEKARIKSIFGSKTSYTVDEAHWLVDFSKPKAALSLINLKVFREKFEMLFLTTNLHPFGKEEPRWEDSVEFTVALRRAFRFEMSADEPCGMFMGQVFTTHFFSKRPQAGSIEIICENALRRFADNGLPAFDNQKSGVLLFVKKDAEKEEPEKLHLLELVVRELRKESNGTIETVQIRFLSPAARLADLFFMTHAVEDFGQEKILHVKFDSSTHTHSDSLEKETGEPNETRDECEA